MPKNSKKCLSLDTFESLSFLAPDASPMDTHPNVAWV